MKNKLVATIVIVAVAILTAAIISVVLPKGQDSGVHYPSTGFSSDSVLKQTGKGSGKDGLSLSVKSYDLAAEYPYIEILWKNETQLQATYGLGYDVQKKVEGVWVSCAVDNVIVPSIACRIGPGEENTHQYNLSCFDIDRNTEYRFVAECYLPDDNDFDNTTRCNMYVEFTIS